MDRNEARLLLQACRPNGRDDALPVFAEARALMDRDAELKAWWEAQQAFDQKISARLMEISVPENLRTTILAGHKIEQLTPRFRLPFWFAAAALILLTAFLGRAYFRVTPGDPARLSAASYAENAVAFLGDDAPSLGTTSENPARLTDWLRERHSPIGAIPVTMGSLPSVGCQTFAVHGHTVSLICFSLADGGVAHLFVVEKQALQDPPGTSPTFQQKGAWATASWSDASKSYLLVTQASPETLRHLL